MYRARDKKLGRDVAIKVLPEHFAEDKERMARFEREARVLASLNHPNIAAVYGLEEDDGRALSRHGARARREAAWVRQIAARMMRARYMRMFFL